MLATLRDLESRGAIKLDDAAIASRAPQAERILIAAAPSSDAGGANPGVAVGSSAPEAQVTQPATSAGAQYWPAAASAFWSAR